MRKSVILALGVIAVLAGCQFEESYQEDSLNGFDVSLESIISEPETKTYVDEQHLVVWHNDDRVSVFEKKEYWEEYKYTGRTGTTGGRLDKITSEGSGTGGDLDYYYAVYPHSELNGFNSQGHLLLTIPHEQPYDDFSFGRGTNLMVSSSEDDSFKFKNIGGYLVFKLYGEGVPVSSIRLAGNSEEEITGDVDVVISPGVDPVTKMSTARYAVKYDDAVLVCDPPVELGATASEYKEFWFVLPPMTFTAGFSIEVTTSNGDVWTKTTEKSWTITRNHYTPVSAMEVEIDKPLINNVIYYTSINGEIVTPYATDVFGASIVSNVYEDGHGILTFDGNVSTIGKEAFAECSNLQSIEIPRSVTDIGNWAFDECINLVSIELPEGVTNIALDAFSRCTSLVSIEIPGSVSANTPSFEGCTSLTSVILHEGVTNACYFKNCSSLISIEIPSSVTRIGNNTFMGCSSLAHVVIPESVTSIGSGAFYGCSSLTQLTIPESVTSIGSGAFYSCSSLTQLTIPVNVTSIGSQAFYNCSGLSSIVIPKNITNIEADVFSGCSSLSSVTISENVTSIGNHAFSGCSSLTYVEIPTGVKSIGFGAFSECSLTSVEIPQSVTNIGGYVFSGCSNLTAIYCLNNNPPTGGEYMFSNTNNCPIYVPAEAVEEYKVAEYWSNYADRIQAKPEAIDLGLSVKWASCNIGASAPEELGDEFVWGETEPRTNNFTWETYKWCNGTNKSLTKYNSNSEFGAVDNKSVLDEEDDAAHVLYGGFWRMPTREEANELFTYCEMDVNYEDKIVTFTSTVNGNTIVFPLSPSAYRDFAVWTKSLSRYSYTPDNAAILSTTSFSNDCTETSRVARCNIRAVLAE